MCMKTTIQIDVELKKLLDELKIHEREPYSSVIRRLIMSKVDEEPLSPEVLAEIEEAIKDIKEGRVYTTEEVEKELGV